jgi:hypothetical protein
MDLELPVDISFEDAYAAIRSWCQANIDLYCLDPERGEHAAESKGYIESLPPPDRASQGEMEDTLRRVLCRDLEWTYHESDGRFKMAAYAHRAFMTAGADPFAA